MARKRFTDYLAIAFSTIHRQNDVLLIEDVSAGRTYKVSPEALDDCRKYVATITQSGTGAPAATVIKNTLGTNVTIAWTRTGTGEYVGTVSSAVLTASKTICRCQRHHTDTPIETPKIGAESTTVVGIIQKVSGVAADGLTKLQVWIEVYP